MGDFNGDGEDDIAYVVMGAGNTATDTLYVLLSTTPTDSSTPSFSQQNFVVGSNPSAVLVADLNGDGLPDIAVSNSGDDSVTVLLEHDGNGRGGGHVLVGDVRRPMDSPTLIVTGEFTGDDRTDLAVQGAADRRPDGPREQHTPGLIDSQLHDQVDRHGDRRAPALNMVAADFLGQWPQRHRQYRGSTHVVINISTNTTTSVLTAEVEENPASGSGSFSIQSPSSTVLDSDTWYYVAFTYAPNVDSNGDDQLTLYVNGQMVAQSTGTGSLPSDPDISGSSTSIRAMTSSR